MKLWVLLDSESTTDIFGESKYLTGIQIVSTLLKLMTNRLHLKNYGNVWYHPRFIKQLPKSEKSEEEESYYIQL